MNTVGIEQEAVSLLTVSSLFPAGRQPHKPCVCSCSGSRCKCFSCFHLGSLTRTHDTPPLSSPSVCHCAHTEQLLHSFGLRGGSQFLRSCVWVFSYRAQKSNTDFCNRELKKQLLCPLCLGRFYSSPFSQHPLTTCKSGPQPLRHV